MADPVAICPVHGPFSAKGLFGPGTFVIEDCLTTCQFPGCGRYAPIVNGTYDIVGSAVRVLRAPGVTREKVERFRDIAQAVQAGAISKQEATSDVQNLNAAFLILWKLCGSAQMAFLVTMLSIALMIMFEQADDEDTARQHRDAQQQIQIQQQILEELKKQNAAVPEPKRPATPTQPTRGTAPTKTQPTAAPNRAARRKAAAEERRGGRKPGG